MKQKSEMEWARIVRITILIAEAAGFSHRVISHR